MEIEVKAWRDRLDEAYLEGRDLAREEEFDKAEAILRDLAEVGSVTRTLPEAALNTNGSP